MSADSDAEADAMADDARDDLQQVADAVGMVNLHSAKAVEKASSLTLGQHPELDLRNTHDALCDTARSVRRALSRTEVVLDTRDSDGRPTPRQITSEHADRLKERYDGPVLNVALMFLDRNRREWLHANPETQGAEAVRRHGLTENQRRWLNALDEAWTEATTDWEVEDDA